jgi:hypothetical protein
MGIVALSAIIMVWRSEGIILGLFGGCIYLTFVVKFSKKNIRKAVIFIIAICVLFGGLNEVQSIGAKKYYGKDYMIINTTRVLYNIFNDPNADFNYEGADKDFEAISAIVPVFVLQQYGTSGYRDYNWTQGRIDFNQTMATDEQADDYMSAYYSLVWHNLSTFIDVQMNNFYVALQIPSNRQTYVYEGEDYFRLEPCVYDEWQYGKDEVVRSWMTEKWQNNKIRNNTSIIINNIIEGWRELINTGINMIMHAIAFILLVIFFFREIIFVIEEKNKLCNRIPYMLAILGIITETIAVIAFMPEGRPAYLYPVLFSSYIIIYFYYASDVYKRSREENI